MPTASPRILQGIGAAPSMRAAAYLVYAGDFLQRPEEVVSKAFGESYAGLVSHTRKLVQIQRSARDAQVEAQRRALQTERVRKMLLAFASDLRVVLLRLASRLQTLRWYAASRRDCPESLARESLDVFAPLANRLGIWQIKWELEDLAFRFLQGADYHRVAALMDGKRLQREAAVELARQQLAAELAAVGLRCEVQGRPKHLYSVWKKMQGKGIDFAQVLRPARAAHHRRRHPRLLCGAGTRTRRLRAGARRVRRLHRQAQAQRLPVAAHRGAWA